MWSPKLFPFLFWGLWIISIWPSCYSKITSHCTSEKQIKRCYAFLQSYHPEAYLFDSLIYLAAQISQILLKLMQPKRVWCQWALITEQLRLMLQSSASVPKPSYHLDWHCCASKAFLVCKVVTWRKRRFHFLFKNAAFLTLPSDMPWLRFKLSWRWRYLQNQYGMHTFIGMKEFQFKSWRICL